MKAVSFMIASAMLAAGAAAAGELSPEAPGWSFSLPQQVVHGLSADIERGWKKAHSAPGSHGIGFELNYTGEIFHGFQVHPSGSTLYQGLVDLHFDLDTNKAGLWPDGKLYVSFQNHHGSGFTIDPADVLLFVSDIGAPDYTEIYEFGLKQNLLKGNLQLEVGKQDANDNFSVNESGGDFTFPSFTLIPTVPMPTFPAPALGVRLSVEPRKGISLDIGFYDGGSQIEQIGFDTFFDGENGYFAIIEPAWKPGFGFKGRLEGNYRAGLWGHSGDFPEIESGLQSKSFDGNYGLYVMINQMIYRPEGDSSDKRGLGIFFQYGWAPSDRNDVSQYLGGGITCKGLLAGRNRDTAAAGIGATRLNGTDPEESKIWMTNVEVFYVAQLTSWLALQPDMQYFSDTGPKQGSGLAVGLRLLVSF